jgi:hypothetical protein
MFYCNRLTGPIVSNHTTITNDRGHLVKGFWIGVRPHYFIDSFKFKTVLLSTSIHKFGTNLLTQDLVRFDRLTALSLSKG